MSCIESSDCHPGLFQEYHRAGVRNRAQGWRNFVQSLPQGCSGGHACNSQGLTEVIVIPAVRYGFKIAFPHRQKPHITAEDIVKTNAPELPGKGIHGLGRQ
jgi:hypothetical protein